MSQIHKPHMGILYYQYYLPSSTSMLCPLALIFRFRRCSPRFISFISHASSSVNLPDELDKLRTSLFALFRCIAAGTILADLLATEHRETPIVSAGTGSSLCYGPAASPPAATGSGSRATSSESCAAFGRSYHGLGPSPNTSLSTGPGVQWR